MYFFAPLIVSFALSFLGLTTYLNNNQTSSQAFQVLAANTANPTATPTITPSPSPLEESPTPSPTLTPTPSITPTNSPKSTVKPTPISTPKPINTPSPTPKVTPTPSPQVAGASAPSATPDVWSPGNLEPWFSQYAGQYGVDKNALEIIANCESHFNPNVVSRNGLYVGLFQFSESAWKTYRGQMGLDINPALRTNAEESIKTAAFMMSKRGTSPWPSCI